MEPEEMLLEDQDPEDLGAEVINRFRNSVLPEHKQLRAVVAAISEALREQGYPLNSTGYFAGVMLALERQSTEGSVDAPETAAFCTFLSLVLPKLGAPVLSSRSDKVVEVLGKILSNENAPAGTIKSGIACVEAAMLAGDKSNWFALAPSFNMMLKLSVDLRPKVRKRAHTCISEVLTSLQSTGSLEKASDTTASYFLNFITPFTQSTGANKNKDLAKEAVQVLYVLGALNHTLPALASKSIAKLLPGMVFLFNLKQPLVTRHVLNALLALSRAPRNDLPGPELAIVTGALSSLVSPENKDVDQVMSAIQVLQSGLVKLRDIDRDLCASNLPAAFNSVTELFASEQEEVTFGAGECLQSLVDQCIDDQMIRDGLNAVEIHGKRKTSVDRICVSVEKSLSYQYSSAWDKALGVVSALFTKLGAASFKLMPEALGTLAELQGLGDEDMPFRSQLSDAFGAAVVAIGPEQFLQRLPLNMDDPDLNKARVWILPVLRQHTVGARLKYFAENIVPLTERLTARAQKYAAEEKPVAAKTVEAWAQSLWALLPSFCNYPVDTKDNFKLIAKLLGDAMKNKPELRGLITSSIQIMINQNKRARDRTDEMELDEAEAQNKYSKAVASANLSAIAAFSDKFLPLLFNLFCESPVEKRGDLQAAIGAIASISSKAMVQKFFKTIVEKLLQVVKAEEAKDRRCMFMDLALSLVKGLDSAGLNTLYAVAKPALLDGDAGVQKKGYKVLANICKEHPEFLSGRSQEILELIDNGTLTCQTSAKQYRVQCLQQLILHFVKEGKQNTGSALQMLLKEAILSLKEANKKTRNAAFELLVGIGHGLLDVSEDDFYLFFHMVVGCTAVRRVAGEPHLISSAITAISRLAYEFPNELSSEVRKFLPSAYHLLSNYKSREVIKSLLGLMKVMVARLSREELDEQLPRMVPSMMAWSDDPKNRFRAKVRLILEKLIKKCGLDAVSEAMPKEHVKHLTNIRKRMEQTEKKKRSVIDGDDKKSSFTRGTTSRSQWKTADVFTDSEDDNDGDDESEGTIARSKSTFRSKKLPKSKKRLPEETGLLEPLDLLDNTKTRALLSSAKLHDDDDDGDESDPEFDPEGRLIVEEQRLKKRSRDEAPNEEDEDDLRERMSKASLKKKGSSSSSKKRKNSSGWSYTGDEFANKKGGAGGDRRKEGKMEPYAYWPLDAKLLNRRSEKKAAARKGMHSVVKVTKKLQGLSVNKALGGIQKKGKKTQNKAHKAGGGSKRKNRR